MPDTTTRTILITGCSRGIGLCMARGLRSRGHHIIAYRMYQRWIDKQNSAHRVQYEAMEQRLLKDGPAAPFTLPPDAVLARVVHALESRRPKIRYYVTQVSEFRLVVRRGSWLFETRCRYIRVRSTAASLPQTVSKSHDPRHYQASMDI